MINKQAIYDIYMWCSEILEVYVRLFENYVCINTALQTDRLERQRTLPTLQSTMTCDETLVH